MSVAADMALLDGFEETITELELFLVSQAKVHDAAAFYLLRSIPGVGKILSMTILYEIYQISRFPGVGHFLSYSRLVKGSWESDGKKKRGASGAKKIGNVHLKWAFSEAAALFLRGNPVGQAYFQRLERKHGKGKAMSVLAAKLGRAVYYMLNRHQPFDLSRFVAA